MTNNNQDEIREAAIRCCNSNQPIRRSEMEHNKELYGLLWAYRQASDNLRAYADRQYPPGAQVKCTATGNIHTVKCGSIHADHLYTNIGLINLTLVERIDV